jgi:hypothetical protein
MKKLNLLKTLSHKKWGSDKRMLLRIHQMVILSILRYGNTGYGSATVIHKGKKENALCEAGVPTLSEMR